MEHRQDRPAERPGRRRRGHLLSAGQEVREERRTGDRRHRSGQGRHRRPDAGQDEGADGKLLEPGNLIFHEGQLISQTLTGVASYPLVQAKLDDIDTGSGRNPNDPKGLTERGDASPGQGRPASRPPRTSGPRLPMIRRPTWSRARDGLFDTLSQLLEPRLPGRPRSTSTSTRACAAPRTRRNGSTARERISSCWRKAVKNRAERAMPCKRTSTSPPYPAIAVWSTAAISRTSRPGRTSGRGRIAAPGGAGHAGAAQGAGGERRRTAGRPSATRRTWTPCVPSSMVSAPLSPPVGKRRLVLAERLLESDKKEDWSEAEQLLLLVPRLPR